LFLASFHLHLNLCRESDSFSPEVQEVFFEAHLGDMRSMKSTRRLCQSAKQIDSCPVRLENTANRTCSTPHCRIWSRYIALHSRALAEHTMISAEARILVCRPYFGQGNRVNALLACLAFAIATDRILLVDWHGQASDTEDGGDSVAAAGGDLSDLVRTPDLAWEVNATVLAQLLHDAAAAGELLTGTHRCDAFPPFVIAQQAHRAIVYLASDSHTRSRRHG
jgi:hypothetical protein